MRSEALPAVLATVHHTDDAWLRDVLIDVLGRIGDPRALPVLATLLDGELTRDAALDALGRMSPRTTANASRADGG
jgi:HEAT repeat protein